MFDEVVLPDGSRPQAQAAPPSQFDEIVLPDGSTPPSAQPTATVGPLEDVSGPQDYASIPSLEPQVVSPDAPQTQDFPWLRNDDQYRQALAPELQSPEAQQQLGNAIGAVEDTAKGLPRFAAQLPGYAYSGYQLAAGTPQDRTAAIEKLLTEAVPQGQQMAAGLQSEPGSKQFDMAAIQAAMMAAPGLDLLHDLKPEVPLKTEAPPIQTPEAPVNAPESPVARSDAQAGSTPPEPVDLPESVGESATMADPVATQIRKAVDSYDFKDQHSGASELADDLEQIDNLPKPLSEALQNYRDAVEEDRTEWGERSGEPELYGERLYKAATEHAAPEIDTSNETAAPTVEQPNETGPYSGVNLKERQKGWVAAMKVGDEVITDPNARIHAQMADQVPEGATAVPGWVDKNGKFIYKYADDAPNGEPSLEGIAKQNASTTRPDQGGVQAGESQAGQPDAAQVQPASVGQPDTAGAGDEAGQPASGEGISIKNEATDALREKYGLEPAVQEARRSLGDAWEKAQGVSRLDPGVGRRILDDINKGKITAVDDVQVAHLTRETIDAVAERNAAADAVNEAKTPEELDSARSRRELAEEHLQNVVDADKKVGTATARGLKARQMAAREDYSLTRMESRARSAYGRKLSPKESQFESSYVKGLHDKLQALSDRMDKMQDAEARSSGKNVLKEATAARKSGKRIIDYTGEAAAKARERINRQLHGLGAKPAPPTLLADYAVVGADHLARGITKFADWSAQMVKEFGDKVNPYLKDIWVRAKAIHNAANKAFRTPAEKADAAMQSRLATETIGLKAKMERGDFTKPTKEPPVYSKATYRMRQEYNAIKGEFERHVAENERKNATPGQKLVTHTAGILRAGVLSSPGIFEKLGVAAGVKEAAAPFYGVARYGYSKIPGISKIAEASGRNPSLKGLATSEFKAKASAITKGIIDAAQTFTKRGSELDRLSGKDKYTRYWYDKVTGAVHAAIKAPVKRAEFTRSLEQRIETSMRKGEDVSHPAVIDRLTNEALIDANRQILQNANAFSNWIGQLDRTGPAGKILKAVLAPVSRVPSNLVIEFWNHALGVPHALLRSGIEGAKGLDDIAPATADSIMRQFSQGTVGLALASYAWYNHDKIGKLLHDLPKAFQHTSQAMVLDLFSSLGNGDQKEIDNMVKYDVPFVKTFTDLSEPLSNASKPKWQQSKEPWAEYGRKQLASRAIPEVSNYVQKSQHTPGSLFEKSLQLNKPVYSKEENKRYFHPASIIEALKERLPSIH